MNRISRKSILGSALIIAAVVFAGTFGFSLNNIHSTPLLTDAAILDEIQPSDFSRMMENEFYMPVAENAQADETTPEARQVLDQIFAAKTQCDINKSGSMVAMGYGCR